MENTIIKRLEKGNDIGVDTCFYFDNDLEINYNLCDEIVELQKHIKELQSRASKVKEQISLNLDKIKEIQIEKENLVDIQIDVTLNKHTKKSRELAEQIKEIEGDNHYLNTVLNEIKRKIKETETELMSSERDYNNIIYNEQLEKGKPEVIELLKSISKMQENLVTVLKRIVIINQIPDEGYYFKSLVHDTTYKWNDHVRQMNPRFEEIVRKFNINIEDLENE